MRLISLHVSSDVMRTGFNQANSGYLSRKNARNRPILIQGVICKRFVAYYTMVLVWNPVLLSLFFQLAYLKFKN